MTCPPNSIDWPSAISALAAITAIGISVWVWISQGRILKRQLKIALFDKRYPIFLTTEEFIAYVIRVDGSIELSSNEVRKFQFAVEQSEFLFKEDVLGYMTRLKKTVFDLYPKTRKRDHLATMGQSDQQLNLEIIAALIEIAGPFVENRKKVFADSLDLNR